MERIVEYAITASEDIEFFKNSGQISVLKKIHELVKAIQQSPFDGIGKPEALKHGLSGCWSRRISKEHRLVYEVSDSHILFFPLKGIIEAL